MGYLIYALLIMFSLVIQTTVLSMWPFLQVSPDLLLIIIVVFSLLNGPIFGAKFGFVAGLALDLLTGNMIGLYGIIRMLIGFSVGLIASRFYKENYVVPLFCVILATLLDQIFYLLGLLVFGRVVPWIFAFQQVLLPLCIYNGILCLLLYIRLFYFNKKIIYWDELFRRAR